MAKKKTEVQTSPPDTLTAEQPPAQPEAPPVHQNGNGRRPDVSWALNSDRTTRVEIAAWVNLYSNQGGETYEQVTFTVQRSYRDQQGQWQRGGSWRTHDIPVLMFLIQKGHNWALDRRTTDSSCPL